MTTQSINKSTYESRLIKARSLVKMINVRLEDHSETDVTIEKVIEMEELIKALEKAKNKLTI